MRYFYNETLDQFIAVDDEKNEIYHFKPFKYGKTEEEKPEPIGRFHFVGIKKGKIIGNGKFDKSINVKELKKHIGRVSIGYKEVKKS